MSKLKPRAALDARIATGAVLAVGGLAASLLLPSAALAAVLLVIVLLGAWEWAHLTGLTEPVARLIYLAAMAVCACGAWQLSVGKQPLTPIVLGLLWWVVALVVLAIYRPGLTQGRLPVLGLRVAGALALLPAWVAMIDLHRSHPQPVWLIFLLLLVWIADSAAFFTGRLLGRTQLAPMISPGKTREGLLGALGAVGSLAVLGAWWLGLPGVLWVYFVGLCLVTALLSVAGDLFESLLKRHAGVKDSGVLLPGHGGVLDRIDSTMAAAPPFALGLHWLN